MVGQRGAGPAGRGSSVPPRAFRRERSPANIPPGARRAASFGPVVDYLLWSARRASGGAREQGVPGHCLGRACFRWRREGAGWSDGGEAGAEPFPLERLGEPSACWEPRGGLLGRLGGEESWGPQRSR